MAGDSVGGGTDLGEQLEPVADEEIPHAGAAPRLLPATLRETDVGGVRGGRCVRYITNLEDPPSPVLAVRAENQAATACFEPGTREVIDRDIFWDLVGCSLSTGDLGLRPIAYRRIEPRGRSTNANAIDRKVGTTSALRIKREVAAPARILHFCAVAKLAERCDACPSYLDSKWVVCLWVVGLPCWDKPSTLCPKELVQLWHA